MQHMLLSLSIRVRGGLTVHSLSERVLTQAVYRLATMNSRREFMVFMVAIVWG